MTANNENLPIQFGKYHLIERIATGGMAELYRAKLYGAGGFEKDLAIKKVLPQLVSDRAFTQMFMDEAMISATLNHGNIVSVIDFGEMEGEYYLVMEYIDGVSLQSVITRSIELNEPIPAQLACWITLQMCRGLDYAHRKSGADGNPLEIVHRDISPHNVLLSFEGEVKLVDFGIARTASRISTTQAGVIKGKAAYMSPEQLSGKQADKRSDIFSVGIVFYEMLTNYRPFEGTTPQETMALIVRGLYPRPQKHNKKLDKKINPILAKALQRNPKRRYRTAGEMASALSVCLHQTGQHPDETALADLIPARLPDARPKTFPPTPTSMIYPTAEKATGHEAISFELLDLPVYSYNPEHPFGEKKTWHPNESLGNPEANHDQIENAWLAKEKFTPAAVPAYGSEHAEVERRRISQRKLAVSIAVGVVFLLVPSLILLIGHSGEQPSAVLHTPTSSSFTQGVGSNPVLPQPNEKHAETGPPLPLDRVQPKPSSIPSPGEQKTKPVSSLSTQASPIKKRKHGTLRIDSKPRSVVYLGNRKLGETPIQGTRLPAGSHTLIMKNSSLDIKRHIRVRIEPNRTHTVFVELDQ